MNKKNKIYVKLFIIVIIIVIFQFVSIIVYNNIISTKLEKKVNDKILNDLEKKLKDLEHKKFIGKVNINKYYPNFIIFNLLKILDSLIISCLFFTFLKIFFKDIKFYDKNDFEKLKYKNYIDINFKKMLLYIIFIIFIFLSFYIFYEIYIFILEKFFRKGQKIIDFKNYLETEIGYPLILNIIINYIFINFLLVTIEEYIFRYHIFKILKNDNPKKLILVNSLIFALIHLNKGILSFIITFFICYFIIAYEYFRTYDLRLTILLHFLTNIIYFITLPFYLFLRNKNYIIFNIKSVIILFLVNFILWIILFIYKNKEIEKRFNEISDNMNK